MERSLSWSLWVGLGQEGLLGGGSGDVSQLVALGGVRAGGSVGRVGLGLLEDFTEVSELS